MFTVLIIDRSNPSFYQLAIHLAEQIKNDDVIILFLSDKENSGKQGNLENARYMQQYLNHDNSQLNTIYNRKQIRTLYRDSKESFI